MSDKSAIEWTDATWNPVTGCTKVSQGCKHCYAEREWPRLAAPREKPNIYTGRAFTDVMCHPEKLNIPLRWAKPRRIFVNSMSDLFHESVPDEFIDKVFASMALCPQHTFQVLTKRPKRMHDYLTEELGDRIAAAGEKFVDEGVLTSQQHADRAHYYTDVSDQERHWHSIYSRWPLPNVWLGVSVEDQVTADERIPLLLQTPAAVRWVSAEPLLSEINLRAIDLGDLYWLNALTSDVRIMFDGGMPAAPRFGKLDWVVAGGESGPKARPMHPDWVRSLRDQCQAAGVPFFFKQ